MSKALEEAFGALAEALENAAAAARKLEVTTGMASAKSSDTTTDAVAGGKPGPKGKKVVEPEPVVEKPAKGGKGKAAAPVITFDMVKAKLTELVNVKSREAARDILSNYGAAKLGDLDEDDYSKVHADAVAALAADEGDGEAEGEEDLFGE